MPPAVPYATTSQKQTRSTADSLLEICTVLTIIVERTQGTVFGETRRRRPD